MKTYLVRVLEPTVYEIEAEDEVQAKKQALELFKKDHKKWLHSWLEPEVQVSEK